MPIGKLLTLVVFLFLGLLPAARGADVALALSSSGGVYAEFEAAFRQYSQGSAWRVRWVGTIDALDGAPPVDLIVAVGSEAARASLRRHPGTPVVATLLPRQAYDQALAEAAPRPRGSVTAIVLDQPVPRLLSFIRHLLPERRRVGVLAGPQTRALLTQLRQTAGTGGLRLESEEVDAEASPVAALNLLLPRSDLLLALPDPSIYRRDNVRAIFLTSYRFRRPVIGFSQAMSTAGALASIYSTPAQIARQAADLIRPLGVETLSLPAPQTPGLFAIAINGSVAQALELSLPDEAALRRAMAAEKEGK